MIKLCPVTETDAKYLEFAKDEKDPAWLELQDPGDHPFLDCYYSHSLPDPFKPKWLEKENDPVRKELRSGIDIWKAKRFYYPFQFHPSDHQNET